MYKREFIDLACLSGGATYGEINLILKQALQFKPRGICLNPVLADYIIRDDNLNDLFTQLFPAKILRQFVIDFPLGQGGIAGKYLIAKELVDEDMADEFDVVANIGAILEKNKKTFMDELKEVKMLQKPVKVIVETGYYPDDLDTVERMVGWCAELGVYAIKTSTGFLKNIDNKVKQRHVALWRGIINQEKLELKIKDSGGKITREDVDSSILAGADIVGASKVIL